MKEYITSEVPAFGKLIAAIQELTEAGVFKWRNHVDKDSATLRLTIIGQMWSPAYNRDAVDVVVGGYFPSGRKMPNYSALLVAGDEAEKLNALLHTYPVDTVETDLAALVTNK
jgi:hypothetical protein